MAWSIFGKKKATSGFAEQMNDGAWLSYFNQYASSLENDKLIKFKQDIAYDLATNVAEIYIPIDAIADRCSSVTYDIVNKVTGELYTPTGNLLRLLKNPNPFDRFSDIVYQSIFSELADGNSYVYSKIPDSLKNPTMDNISNVWVLKPNKTQPIMKKEISNPFLMKSISDVIESYKTHFMYEHNLDTRYVYHKTVLGIGNDGKGISPLTSCHRNINNILAVYQARYNVYAKNGTAGILSKAPTGGGGASLQEAIDPITRDTMMKDLQDRQGLIGDKNFIGISSVPVVFTKTLGTIKELEPFEETLEDAIKIAGVFGVNKELIPKKDNATFSNQQIAEKSFWQNVVKAMCNDKAIDLNKIFYLPDDLTFKPNFNGIEALQEDKKSGYEADKLYIENIKALQESGSDMTKAILTIEEKYNGT